LTGAGLSERPDRVPPPGAGGNAAFAIVMNIAHFGDHSSIRRSIDEFMDRLKRVKPAPGFDEVMVPGEPEIRARAVHEKEGIVIDDANWDPIANIARANRIDFKDIL